MWSEKLIKSDGNAAHTNAEIFHQPKLWKKIWKKIYDNKDEIKEFVNSGIEQSDNIVLTGAGTSAYIGIAVQRSFRNKFNKIAEPISTTHIVSHPTDFFLKNQNLFLVSFARSGNSPESSAVVKLADNHTKNCKHLIITCNPEGDLAKNHKENGYVFTLPPEANDKSLAMTSSYSGMMIAGILISRIDEIEALESEVDKLVTYGNNALSQAEYIYSISAQPFTRAIFLGSGALYGVAKEAQLKMQELTDGMVICKHDSFLGLRHGPKAVIDENTLVVYHLSNNPYASRYELDLLQTMKDNSCPMGQLAIGEHIGEIENMDWKIELDCELSHTIDKDLLSVASILPAQLLAMYKSIHLGLKPDNPSRNGAISRVVQGVNIYN
ncbi:SIS domain-containing protein [Portibacter lacus]|uniref:Tagatose-6-phosphate ketose n=1 Tax=Portibacter lacus TaxID=1099794 RepID=A0AA37ST99_9BACT|nr:SIS domain-containing protein [Portibacter lacus]GLR17585.1 tagatose-6-phosphate ketose [Portibacter lacus]